MEGIKLIAFPEPRQRATIVALVQQLDDAVLQAGRAGGQTILQGVTLEGGVVVNDLDVDVDFLVNALGGIVGLNVDGASGFVSIGTATPSTELYVVGVVKVKGKVANANLDLETADGAQLWRHQNTQGSGLYIFRDATNGKNCLSILPNTPTNTLRLDPSGVALFGAGSFGGGVGVLFLGNRTTAPTTNPAGGGVLSIDAGVAKYIGPTGPERRLSLGAQHARTTAQQNTTSISLVDITGLTFNVEAGRTYELTANLFTALDATGNGFRFSLTGTATATAVRGVWQYTNYGFPNQDDTQFSALPGTGLFAPGAGTAVKEGRAELTATITVAAAGTLKLQFSAFTAGQSTVQAGSTFRLQEIA